MFPAFLLRAVGVPPAKARRIAANIAKLPELLSRRQTLGVR
jgi:hypothetical protein